MDPAGALPEDALADILTRLRPRDLAASRCVRTKAWRTVVDARGLLLRRLLPHSVQGIVLNYAQKKRPYFLARPSTQHPGVVDYGNLRFIPRSTKDYHTVADHWNALLLVYADDAGEFCLANPATRRWELLPGEHGHGQQEGYLVFDPAVSPQYKVILIPTKDLGLFGVDDCARAELRLAELTEEFFTITSSELDATSGPRRARGGGGRCRSLGKAAWQRPVLNVAHV